MSEKINVLHIEDDDNSAHLILTYLRLSDRNNFNIIRKKTIKDTLEYLDTNCKDIYLCEIDVILLDLVLPDSKGIGTFKMIKNKCDFIPIIIISAHEETTYECVKLGAQDYIFKLEASTHLLERSIIYSIGRKKLENKYRYLVEVTGAIIFEIDYVSGKFAYVNDVMCKQLEWSKDELLNMGPVDVLTESSMLNFVKRQESMSRREYIDDVFEYEGIRKDGSTFWMLTTSEFIQDKNKNVINENVVGIDITSQKLAEEALKKKETEVFMALESKIHEWKEEIIVRNNKKEKQLKLIDSEILSLNVGEVS